MQTHFASFTAEGMRAFGQELAAEFERRREFASNNRRHTFQMLSDFHRARARQSHHDADQRRLFMSELRSKIHAMKNRFSLAGKEVAADRARMADECHAAQTAFRNRPTRWTNLFFGRGGRFAMSGQAEDKGYHVEFEGGEKTSRRDEKKRK